MCFARDERFFLRTQRALISACRVRAETRPPRHARHLALPVTATHAAEGAAAGERVLAAPPERRTLRAARPARPRRGARAGAAAERMAAQAEAHAIPSCDHRVNEMIM